MELVVKLWSESMKGVLFAPDKTNIIWLNRYLLNTDYESLSLDLSILCLGCDSEILDSETHLLHKLFRHYCGFNNNLSLTINSCSLAPVVIFQKTQRLFLKSLENQEINDPNHYLFNNKCVVYMNDSLSFTVNHDGSCEGSDIALQTYALWNKSKPETIEE